MTERSGKFAFAKELPRHLAELEVLLKRHIEPRELLSVEETRLIRARASQVARWPLCRWKLPFLEKEDGRFRAFVANLSEANPADVYVWTPASNVCGLLRPVALARVSFSFPFELNPEGILTILTIDLSDQLLLDYSMGEGGEAFLEMECSGEHWGRVAY